MRALALALSLFTFSAFALDPVLLRNDREGKSAFESSAVKRARSRALKLATSEEILRSFDEIILRTDENKLCAFDLNRELRESFGNRIDLKGLIWELREKNRIDDVVTKLLLSADDVLGASRPGTLGTRTIAYPGKEKFSELLTRVTKINTDACLDEEYRKLWSDLLEIDKGLTNRELEGLLLRARSENLIQFDTYSQLEKARISELEKGRLTLKTYLKKKRSLRLQFPLRVDEKSDFVTEASASGLSRRQKLLENYTDLQIALMGDVIKKLRKRLDSKKAEIVIFDRDEASKEVITLGPMERFRLSVKLLRQEMANLPLNTYFKGVSPDYMDLMTAAFETGIIPGVELDEVAGIEEIWNPKRTFWDKARTWVQMAGSVATIVTPPPYGFVPALALIVIEATAGKDGTANDLDPTSLF
jgi:hypothetical protein